MKKILALILALCMLVVVLAACGGDSTDTPASGGTEPPAIGWPKTAGLYDADYDYSQHKTFRVAYLLTHASPMFENNHRQFVNWAPRLNIDYTGMWAPTVPNSADEYLTGLETYLSQGYDGIITDIDPVLAPRVRELCAEYGVPWIQMVAQGRDYSEPYMMGSEAVVGPLQNLNVGFNSINVGQDLLEKCVEWKNEAHPDVSWDEVGVIAVSYSIVPTLNERMLGAKMKWCELFPQFGTYSPSATDFPKNFWYADGAVGGMDAQTSQNLVTQIVSNEPQIKVWLIPCAFDDYAMGAANAAHNLGINDITCVVSNGGVQMAAQYDAGVDGAWRFSQASNGGIYVNFIMNALWAQMAGQATSEELYPEWVSLWDKGDYFEYTGATDPVFGHPIVAFGADGKPVTKQVHNFASVLLPNFWIGKDNYQQFFAWSDFYSYGADTSLYMYPQYPAVTDINLFSTNRPVPAHYKTYPN